MWWLLSIAVWAGLIVYLVVAYRRKVRGRGRERDAQIEQMMAEFRAAKDKTLAVAVVPGITAPVPAATPWVRNERLLDKPRALVYLLLRAALPDHEIFANLMLSDVIGVGAQGQGIEREQHAKRLAQVRADFVVCTRQLVPVAVVNLKADGADAPAVERLRFMTDAVGAATLRQIIVDPAAAVRPAALRKQVLGE